MTGSGDEIEVKGARRKSWKDGVELTVGVPQAKQKPSDENKNFSNPEDDLDALDSPAPVPTTSGGSGTAASGHTSNTDTKTVAETPPSALSSPLKSPTAA